MLLLQWRVVCSLGPLNHFAIAQSFSAIRQLD